MVIRHVHLGGYGTNESVNRELDDVRRELDRLKAERVKDDIKSEAAAEDWSQEATAPEPEPVPVTDQDSLQVKDNRVMV